MSQIGQKKYEKTEITSYLEGSSSDHPAIDDYMQERLERLKPFKPNIRTWEVPNGTETMPCFIEGVDEENGANYELSLPSHRVTTNIPIDNIDEIKITTPTLHGEEEQFAGYGITPIRDSQRLQRELMPEDKIGRVIRVEMDDGSLAYIINVPASAIIELDEDIPFYGHPDQDGACIRPGKLNKSSKFVVPEGNFDWDGESVISAVLTDGNTSRVIPEADLDLQRAIIMADEGDGKVQILGNPEPFCDLALGHTAEIGQFINSHQLVWNVATRTEKIKEMIRDKEIPPVEGGTTASFLLQLMPSNRLKNTFIRNINFEPYAGPDKTNLGLHSVIEIGEKGELTVKQEEMGSVKVVDPFTLQRNNQTINDLGALPGLSPQFGVSNVKPEEVSGYSEPSVRIITSDGVEGIKNEKLLFETLTAEMSPEKVVDALSSTDFITNAIDLHSYDDATMVITVPAQLRKGKIKPPKATISDGELNEAIVIAPEPDDVETVPIVLGPPEKEPETPIEFAIAHFEPLYTQTSEALVSTFQEAEVLLDSEIPRAQSELSELKTRLDEEIAEIQEQLAETSDEVNAQVESQTSRLSRQDREMATAVKALQSIDKTSPLAQQLETRKKALAKISKALVAQEEVVDELEEISDDLVAHQGQYNALQGESSRVDKLENGLHLTRSKLEELVNEQDIQKELNEYQDAYEIAVTAEAIRRILPEIESALDNSSIILIRNMIDPENHPITIEDIEQMSEDSWDQFIDVLELLEEQGIIGDVADDMHGFVRQTGAAFIGMKKQMSEEKGKKQKTIKENAPSVISTLLASINTGMLTEPDTARILETLQVVTSEGEITLPKTQLDELRKRVRNVQTVINSI